MTWLEVDAVRAQDAAEGRRTDRSAVVYRLHSALGELLYVGTTRTTTWRRVQAHLREPWGHQVRWVAIERHADAAAALAAERQAIHTESPTCNVRSVPHGARTHRYVIRHVRLTSDSVSAQ